MERTRCAAADREQQLEAARLEIDRLQAQLVEQACTLLCLRFRDLATAAKYECPDEALTPRRTLQAKELQLVIEGKDLGMLSTFDLNW